ncbi:dihydrodipicolinate synthase family protein [Allorhodopirellula heiligendammensis]|uniref:L-2-keto-3-deoxyarabonate dehydratase n=1 Tax=Allorhodopirellula heiligendammensis TaxID=2714739 RepID=A0A5C6BD08_9BACT|nr:dihydrodipicolinate synthase family protein [Allorhodopirellula heiligendammensis]TWU09993.1 L-2-keto-3-deoxyarabonate dehydratase [Allorhodopirellula heiligendammensis]
MSTTTMKPSMEGVFPVLSTPFDAHDEIDRDSLQRQIDWAFQLGSNGVCSAMVSEILRLTSAERVDLNQLIVEMAAGRGAVVASVGAESVKQAVYFANAAVEAGCDALMAIPPVTTRLPLAALQDYFRILADAVPVPLIVQDASSYVGAAIPTEFYVRLLDQYGPQKILFKPEGAPIGPNLSDLRDASGGRANMFDGSGGILLIDAYRRGVVGTMPGADLLDGIVALWNALKAGDDETAYRIYFPICAIVALQLQAGLDGFLAIEKYILVKRGLFTTDRRREPNAWALDVETRHEVDRLLEMLTQAVSCPQ